MAITAFTASLSTSCFLALYSTANSLNFYITFLNLSGLCFDDVVSNSPQRICLVSSDVVSGIVTSSLLILKTRFKLIMFTLINT